jgi:hypothetical protein
MEVIADALGAKCREILDFQIARFFQVVVIGDDVGALLGHGGHRRSQREEQKAENRQSGERGEGRHGFSLQMICNYAK